MCPARQSAHATEPVEGVYWPVGHVVQVVAPSALYLPAAQREVMPPTHFDPAGQGVHASAGDTEYVPSPHCVQKVLEGGEK